MFRKLYNKTIDVAGNKNSKFFLGGISFIESFIFPIPPDVVIIPMTIAKPQNWLRIALIATIGSVLGAILGYLIGLLLFNSIGIIVVEFYHLDESIQRFKELYNLYGAWIVIIAGFTPFPFKLITIASGLFELNFIIFIFCSIFSRGARFYLVSGLLYFFGENIKKFIDKYFNILTILFFVLLIGSVLILKVL